MADVAAIIDSVRQMCLLSTADVADAKLVKFIDEGNDKVSASADWPWLRASADVDSASGTGVVALPATFGRLRAVLLDGDSTKLAEISDSEGWERWGDDLPSGTPRVFWFIDAASIQLSPVDPGVTSTVIKFWKQPVVLDGTADVPEFDDRFHQVLADWCLYRVWQREEDYTKAGRHEAAFYAGLNDMAGFYFNQGQDHPLVMGEPADFVQRRVGAANMPFLDGA